MRDRSSHTPRLDHIAILVEDIEAAVDAWELPEQNEIEAFPAEGTRELYCGAARRSGRVLLMQPIGPGPYRRAMEKRGPGLHHVAVYVEDLLGFVSGLAGSGWLLHPKSLETYRSNRHAWLCRPGFPGLVEVGEGSGAYDGAYVRDVSLAVPEALEPLLDALACAELQRSTGPRHSLEIDGRRIWLDALPAT